MHKGTQKCIKIHRFCPAICPAKVPYVKEFFIMCVPNAKTTQRSGEFRSFGRLIFAIHFVYVRFKFSPHAPASGQMPRL